MLRSPIAYVLDQVYRFYEFLFFKVLEDCDLCCNIHTMPSAALDYADDMAAYCSPNLCIIMVALTCIVQRIMDNFGSNRELCDKSTKSGSLWQSIRATVKMP